MVKQCKYINQTDKADMDKQLFDTFVTGKTNHGNVKGGIGYESLLRLHDKRFKTY